MKSVRIVEFEHSNGFRVGGILEDIGQKYLVVAQDGTEFRVSHAEVVNDLSELGADESRAALLKVLADLETDAAEMAGEIDLKALWELVGEEHRLFTLAELCHLIFPSVSPGAKLALARALRTDGLHFKIKKHEFEPRTRESVAEMSGRIQKEMERFSGREELVDELARILDLPAYLRSEPSNALLAHESSQKTMRLLQAYAASDDLDPHPEATDFLDALEARIERAIPGEGTLKAFDLMVELRLWEEHENLAFRRFNTQIQFSPQVLEQAQTIANSKWVAGAEREDFTGWWTLTIDDAETRDIDDGFSVRPSMNGGWELAIHIADPSAQIKLGSALDRAARSRGTSIYSPECVVPMLPPILSEGAFSLVQGETRPAITTHVVVDEALQVLSWRIVQSIVKVDRRLSYDQADRLLENDSREHVAEILGTLMWFAEERLIDRLAAGAVQIDMPEPRLKIKMEDGEPVGHLAILGESGSRTMVTELMVWSNELAARFLHQNDIPAVYRVQDAPDQMLSGAELTEIPEGVAREFAVLRRMKRAEVSLHPGLHFGLGLTYYVQASSPIRRYTDLVIQRQIKACLSGAAAPYDTEQLYQIVADVERASYEAQQIEREAQEYWMTWLLSQVEPGQKLTAVVVDIAQDGRTLVMLTDYGYRVLVRLRKPPSLGAQVELEVERADARRGMLMLRHNP